LDAPINKVSDLDLVGFVCIAIVTSESDIVLLAATAFCQRDYVIELHLIVLKVFATVLAGIVIAANNTYFDSEWNVATSPSAFCCLGESLCRKYYRTDVAKHCASRIGNYSWDTLRVAFGIERSDLLLEYLPPGGVDRATVRELAGSQTLLQIFVMQYCLFTRTR
jgi:hypothetical protein